MNHTVQEAISNGEGTQSGADPVPTWTPHLSMFEEPCIWCGKENNRLSVWCSKKCYLENKKNNPQSFAESKLLKISCRKQQIKSAIAREIWVSMRLIIIIFIAISSVLIFVLSLMFIKGIYI
jgi:hypothetical protein